MILQSLSVLYRQSGLDKQLPYGFEQKRIPFVVLINNAGWLVDIRDTRTMIGKKAVGQSFLVPQGVKRSSGISSNLLWDVAEYALAIDYKNQPDRTQKQFETFNERLKPYCILAEVRAVYDFLSCLNHTDLAGFDCWRNIIEGNSLISFQIEGSDRLVCQSQAFIDLYLHMLDSDFGKSKHPCLISGDIGSTATVHPTIKNVAGAQSSGSNIVSFNSPAFTSWSKKQGFNAPVSNRAAFEYTTALNSLLESGSSRCFRIGSRTFAFWSDVDCEIEPRLKALFTAIGRSENKQVDKSYEHLLSLKNGEVYGAFYMLGLAPTNARLSVCLWHKSSIKVLLTNLSQWFEDLSIVGVEAFGLPTLELLLKSISFEYKSKLLSNGIITDVMGSMLTGSLLPHTLLTALLNRIRIDDGKVNYVRASFLKAALNRKYRAEEKHDMTIPTVLQQFPLTAYKCSN